MKARRIIYPALCAAGMAFFFANRYISARLGAAASATYSPEAFFAYSDAALIVFALLAVGAAAVHARMEPVRGLLILDAALLAVYTALFFSFRGVSPGWGVGMDYSFALWLLGAVNLAVSAARRAAFDRRE